MKYYLVDIKAEILADNIILDYHNEGSAFGFYGYLETEKSMDIFCSAR